MPLSLAVLRRKAGRIAESYGITTLVASSRIRQKRARRHGLAHVALHGPGASVNVNEAAERMAHIRRQLA